MPSRDNETPRNAFLYPRDMNASIAFILFAAAITPGPNNLVVLDVARRGLFATVAPITGIILGTLVLILGIRLGIDVALSGYPKAETIMRVAGACVLGYLAMRVLLGSWSKPSNSDETPIKNRALFFAMFSFQVVNPKTWVLASAVSTTHASQNDASFLPLVLLTVIVPTGCLIVWSAIGQLLGRFFQQPTAQKVLCTAFSLMFVSFAAILLMAD